MNTYIITAMVSAIFAASAVYKIDHWQFDAKEKEHVEQILDAERRAAAKALRNQETVIAAQSEAARRSADLRRDAAGARAAADGLRSATDQTLRDAAASLNACLERANTLGELFVTVEEAGRGMAEKAGLHASDVKTLTDAWPK